MEEKNDDDTDPRSMPNWTKSGTGSADQENKNDHFKEAADMKQGAMEDVNMDGDGDIDAQVVAHVDMDVDVDNVLNVDEDLDGTEMENQEFESKDFQETEETARLKSTPDWLGHTSTRQDSTTHLEDEYEQMVADEKKDAVAENDGNVDIALLDSTKEAHMWITSKPQQDTAHIVDRKGKGIMAEEAPIAPNTTKGDAVDAVKKQQAANVSLRLNRASTSQYVATPSGTVVLAPQNTNMLDTDAMALTSDYRVPGHQNLSAPASSSENTGNVRILDFTDGVKMKKTTSSLNHHELVEPIFEEEPTEAQEQCGSRVFAQAQSFQDVDYVHMLNFMDNIQMDTMTSTPDWRMPGDLSPEEMQVLEEARKHEEQSREEQAREQYRAGTPEWSAPATNEERIKSVCFEETTNEESNRCIRLKETARRDCDTTRAEKERGPAACETARRDCDTIRVEEGAPVATCAKPAVVPQAIQTFMYPLPEMDQLLKLPIYHTYHHHHIHELRKGNFDSSCPKSTSTDSSYHTHTSEHRPMKVETRLFTFNCDSSVVAYFRNNKVNIRVTSMQLATYTTVVVKRDLLEFVHHIVHRHDVHVVNPHYQDHFNLTSVCSQTCTRTKTQSRLFGPVGDFLHTHFHEFIHTIFVGAPVEEDATVYSQYLHLGTIYRPKHKSTENVQTEQELSANVIQAEA